MEERKTAAWVLSILALIFIYFVWVVPYINLKKTHILAFKSCTIKFKYRFEADTTEWTYDMAQNELAVCLCDAYDKTHDPAIGKHLIWIYKKWGCQSCTDSLNRDRYNLDSILKHRDIVFNSKYGWDD